MSRTLETKKKILELLENKKMTITELSKELGLSKATVSQHIDELTRINAVEKVDTEYYKKLKYYKTTTNYPSMFAKVIGAMIILGVVAYLALSYMGRPQTSYPGLSHMANNSTTTAAVSMQNNAISASNATVTPGQIPGIYSCIFLSYSIEGRIAKTSGFSVYTLNYTSGNTTRNVTDYVINRGSSGSFSIAENVTNALKEPQGYNTTRMHYYLLRYNNSIGDVYQGVNITYSPKSFQAANSSINTTAYVSIAQNASYGTYWINFDGPCGGGIGPELLTIGSKPYNGTIREPVNIFG